MMHPDDKSGQALTGQPHLSFVKQIGFFLMKKLLLTRIYINLPVMKRPSRSHRDGKFHLAKTQLIFTDESGK